ncbi:MAG: hypothetical protein Q4C45_07485 [Oscillospiraceae bacterium]|nr:hypothetical protein [Oscillospiraceae bacterium]
MKRELSPAFRRYLMTEGELTGAEIDSMTPNELFKEVLQLEGVHYYAENIKRMVKDCYGIDLNHYEEYLDLDSLACMEED